MEPIARLQERIEGVAWPTACICTGVNVTAILEAAPPQTAVTPRGAASSPSSSQPQSFSDSLHDASTPPVKTPSEPSVESDGGAKAPRRVKSSPEGAKEEAAVLMPAISAQTTMPRQIVSPQLTVPVVPTVISTQTTPAVSVTSDDVLSAMADKLSGVSSIAGIGATAVPTIAARSHGLSSSEARSGGRGLQDTRASVPVVAANTEASILRLPEVGGSVSTFIAKADPDAVAPRAASSVNPAQRGVLKVSSDSDAVPAAAQAISESPSHDRGISSLQPAVSDVSSSNPAAVSGSPQVPAAQQLSQSTQPIAATSSPMLPVAASAIPAKTLLNNDRVAVHSSSVADSKNPILSSLRTAATSSSPSLPVASASDPVALDSSAKKSATSLSLPSVVVAKSPVAVVPSTTVATTDSAPKKNASPSAEPAATGQPEEVTPASEQSSVATALSFSAVTVGQAVTLNQPSAGALGVKTGVLSANAVSAAKTSGTNSTNATDGAGGAAGVKQQGVSPVQSGSQADSQSSSSGDQSQGDSSVPVQNAAMAQVNLATHTAGGDLHAQTTAVTPVVPVAPSASIAPGHPSSTADRVASAEIAAAPTPPVINTAKVIQSMGQTEMRVGMRSDEFGAISIRTSATRDLVSAQISLDHGDLAKVLATHLPEMQSRLGGQAVDVRIDMNGHSMGQGGGGGMTNGASGASGSSADESRSGRQQGNNEGSSNATNGMSEWQPGASAAAAATVTSDSRLSARLDIRV